MAESAGPKPITDISQPGKTPPNASSRPIIVSHKPTVQDTMLGAPAQKSEASQKIPVTQVSTQSPAESEPAQASSQTPSAPPQEPVSPAHIKQLVHDRTYFVPVSEPPRRHGIPWLFVLLALSLIAAGLYLLLTME